MVKIKSKEAIKKKFREAIPRVGSAYKDAVSQTTGVIAAAIAGEDLYAQKVQEAISARRRANALSRVTDADWQKAASTKGAARIGPGMSAAVDKQATNFAPFHDTLASLELPARTADPMANVTARVGGVVQALVAKKKEIKG